MSHGHHPGNAAYCGVCVCRQVDGARGKGDSVQGQWHRFNLHHLSVRVSVWFGENISLADIIKNLHTLDVL